MQSYPVIPNEEAIDRMVRFMGMQFINFDGNIYSTFRSLSGNAYDGGLWEFREYPNGAVVMVYPSQEMVTCTCHGLMKDVEMTLEALSLVANAFVLRGIQNAAVLHGDDADAERLHDLYHGVRDAVSGLMNFVITDQGISEPTEQDLLKPRSPHPESQKFYDMLD